MGPVQKIPPPFADTITEFRRPEAMEELVFVSKAWIVTEATTHDEQIGEVRQAIMRGMGLSEADMQGHLG